MLVSGAKMSETRRPLGSLGSDMNVGGADYLRRRVQPEETPLQRQIRRMYERREESWRPLNRQRVEAFLRLFLLCFVEPENGLPLHPVTYQKLKRALANRIIPWMEFRIAPTMEERYWPISMGLFEQVDFYMAAHLPELYCGNQWGTIKHFYREVKKQEKEERERRKERASRVRRVLEL